MPIASIGARWCPARRTFAKSASSFLLTIPRQLRRSQGEMVMLVARHSGISVVGSTTASLSLCCGGCFASRLTLRRSQCLSRCGSRCSDRVPSFKETHSVGVPGDGCKAQEMSVCSTKLAFVVPLIWCGDLNQSLRVISRLIVRQRAGADDQKEIARARANHRGFWKGNTKDAAPSSELRSTLLRRLFSYNAGDTMTTEGGPLLVRECTLKEYPHTYLQCQTMFRLLDGRQARRASVWLALGPITTIAATAICDAAAAAAAGGGCGAAAAAARGADAAAAAGGEGEGAAAADADAGRARLWRRDAKSCGPSETAAGLPAARTADLGTAAAAAAEWRAERPAPAARPNDPS